jgi:hypothetical protein
MALLEALGTVDAIDPTQATQEKDQHHVSTP